MSVKYVSPFSPASIGSSTAVRAPASRATVRASRGETSRSKNTVVACVLRTSRITEASRCGDGSDSGVIPVIAICFSP
jgi:hypothetical protein